jgi:hypothetical protein
MCQWNRKKDRVRKREWIRESNTLKLIKEIKKKNCAVNGEGMNG